MTQELKQERFNMVAAIISQSLDELDTPLCIELLDMIIASCDAARDQLIEMRIRETPKTING